MIFWLKNLFAQAARTIGHPSLLSQMLYSNDRGYKPTVLVITKYGHNYFSQMTG